MTHAELLERILAAKGPSRELDREVLLACGFRELRVPMDSNIYWTNEPTASSRINVLSEAEERPTASLDSAVALIERVKPGDVWTLSSGHVQHDDEMWFGAEVADFIQTADYPPCLAPTPALALIAALLRSLTP